MATLALQYDCSGSNCIPTAVETTPKSHTSPPPRDLASRVVANTVLTLVGIGVISHLAWAESPVFLSNTSDAQRQSAVVPWLAVARVFQQVAGSELGQHWNVPALALAVFIFWLLTVVGVGHAIIRRLICPGDTSSAALATLSYATGFLVIGLTVLLLGLAGLLHPGLMAGLLALGSSLGIYELVKARRSDGSFLCCSNWGNLSWWAWPLIIFGLLAFLCTWTPPVQSDAMRYHLGALQEYLKHGRITYLSHNAFSNFPFLVEMHYLVALALDVPECTQMMHFSILVASAFAVAALAQQASTLAMQASGFAGALYFLLPAGLVVATWPNVDHGATLYVVASTFALLQLWREPNLGTWILLGVTCAGCLGIKYTLGPHVALMGVLAVLSTISRPSTQRQTVLHAAVASFIVLSAGGVWFAKSYFFTGNPAYPLANSLFSGRDWTQESTELYARKAAEKGQPKTLPNLVTSPIDATFRWFPSYENHNLGSAPLVAGLLLVGLTFMTVRRRMPERRAIIVIVLTGGAQWLVWFFSYQSNRMLLPAVALAFAGLPAIFDLCSRKMRHFATAVLAAGALYGGLWALQWMYVLTGLSPVPAPYLLGATSKNQYMANSLNYWRAFDYLNRRVPLGQKVLMVGEHRVYGARFEAVWSDWFDTPAIAVLLRKHKVDSIDQLNAALDANQINWILINEAELAPQLDQLFRPRFSAAEWKIVEHLRNAGKPAFERLSFPPGVIVLKRNDPVSP